MGIPFRFVVALMLVGALAVIPSAQGREFAARDDASAWLFDPLRVNTIDLNADGAALAALRAEPTKYIDAEITLHDGSTSYGPYPVGLKLKGHSSFRDLDAKSAFRIKFGHVVPHQKFEGLKSLTLNNMVQDPSMIAEATSSVMLRAIGVPTPRVGYAWVRLNGDDYGLYTAVEPIDKVMAKRWFPSTQHIYEPAYAADVIPGDAAKFAVNVGPSKDTSDLDALIAAASGDAAGWANRMAPVADLAEMARVFAAEHYIGQWDGYSYGSEQTQPNNYLLASDSTGRFSIIVTGTDQTWLDGQNFALTGNGVLFRECLDSAGCQPLYIAALRQIAANHAVQELATTARSIDTAIASWRGKDQRDEQSASDGEAQAQQKIAFMASRPAVLAKWLGDDSAAVASAPASSPRPLLGKPVTSPAAPIAGKSFTFTLGVIRSDTRAPLSSGRLECDSTVLGRPVAHVESFKSGRVRLSLRLPATARGKQLVVKVQVASSGRTALGIYTYTVR
jgi:hypothetical protein